MDRFELVKGIGQEIILEGESSDDVNKVLKVLKDVNARETFQKIAGKFECRALEELDRTGDQNEAMDKLKTLANFLVNRTY